MLLRHRKPKHLRRPRSLLRGKRMQKATMCLHLLLTISPVHSKKQQPQSNVLSWLKGGQVANATLGREIHLNSGSTSETHQFGKRIKQRSKMPFRPLQILYARKPRRRESPTPSVAGEMSGTPYLYPLVNHWKAQVLEALVALGASAVCQGPRLPQWLPTHPLCRPKPIEDRTLSLSDQPILWGAPQIPR